VADIRSRLSIINEPTLYIDGKKVLDIRGLRLISVLDEVNSLLEASKLLGIPYSRAWEYIAKLERILKVDIIRVTRGGRGGLLLTQEGLEIVKYIKNSIKAGVEPHRRTYDIDLHIAGSDDTLLSSVIGVMKRKHYLNILYSKIGSLRGLFSLMMGDAHIAPIHLLDPDIGEYNVPYVRRLGLDGYTVIITGYEREVGFIYRKDISVKSIEDIVQNDYRIVNRCRGAGIRILFDNLIKEYAENHRMSFGDVLSKLKGYDDEAETHEETVTYILGGTADVTLGLKIDASSAGLGFTPLKWES